MNKVAAALCLLMVGCVSVFAQPKVAVLDTLVDAKMDQSVIVPVTEKIIERFVVSGRYKVLDRSNVQQVLFEREFQLSGMVSDAEITQAGRFLGADFVVVPRVQLIADTFFLTCKMIDVETGVIANQASTEGEGKLSILLGMAERVGASMAGAAVNGVVVAQQLEQPQQTPAPSTAVPVKPSPAAAKPEVD
ncbi:MAG: penicillin-binding protein activator LpoB, partial [Spirochaetes bacterium]|nr:penicillin-binding protein activator LpoB [Spirochaetota bacterium]MBU0955362.1 penicillin-binding protein activator LpoB [Spirochaetota bacterium]